MAIFRQEAVPAVCDLQFISRSSRASVRALAAVQALTGVCVPVAAAGQLQLVGRWVDAANPSATRTVVSATSANVRASWSNSAVLGSFTGTTASCNLQVGFAGKPASRALMMQALHCLFRACKAKTGRTHTNMSLIPLRCMGASHDHPFATPHSQPHIAYLGCFTLCSLCCCWASSQVCAATILLCTAARHMVSSFGPCSAGLTLPASTCRTPPTEAHLAGQHAWNVLQWTSSEGQEQGFSTPAPSVQQRTKCFLPDALPCQCVALHPLLQHSRCPHAALSLCLFAPHCVRCHCAALLSCLWTT